MSIFFRRNAQTFKPFIIQYELKCSYPKKSACLENTAALMLIKQCKLCWFCLGFTDLILYFQSNEPFSHWNFCSLSVSGFMSGIVSTVVFTGLVAEQKNPLMQHVQQLVRSANPTAAFIHAERGAVTRQVPTEKWSFICFGLFCELFTPHYKWFCFLNRCLNLLGHSSTVHVQNSLYPQNIFISHLGLSLFSTSYPSFYPEPVYSQKSQFCGSFIFKIKPRY